MADKGDELAGTQRAAILLMSLGEQDAASVLKQLDAREVQKLGIAMAELKEVSREQMTSVLDKFIGVADSKANIAGGSQDYVRRVLTQAVGKQKADMLLDRVSTGQSGQGIEALKWMESKAVAQIISGEHPQIAAIVLSHLEPEQAAGILPLLTEDMRTEVLMRIASLNEVPQSALTELDQLVEKQANAVPPAALRRIGGARTVANILNAMEREKSGEELGKIEKADTEMHQQIKDLLFIFDNLLDVDDRGIQALLREVGSDTLAVALRGAEPEVQEKVLKNMSKRAAEILKDDMEARGPVKLTDVEAAQKEIVVIAQRLAGRGHHQPRRQGRRRICLIPRSSRPWPMRAAGPLRTWETLSRFSGWPRWAASPICRPRRTRKPSIRAWRRAARRAGPKYAPRSSACRECSTIWRSLSRRWMSKWSVNS